jgi:lipopolysaccharide biosynthesis glycosyltransferase
MKWFFAMSQSSLGHKDHNWHDMIYVAVKSALANTELVPHLLYDGEDDAFLQNLRDLNVQVIFHRLPFFDQLAALGKIHRADNPNFMGIAAGAFLRTQVPLFCDRYDERALYTDCDVLFVRNPVPDLMRMDLPQFFAAAGQMDRNSWQTDMNSGVMLMNVRAMRDEMSNFISFLLANFQSLSGGFDQPALRQYYKGRWAGLPDRFNWKPYWGWSDDATILHFHGPKPAAVAKLLSQGDYETNRIWKSLFQRNPVAYRRWYGEWRHYLS